MKRTKAKNEDISVKKNRPLKKMLLQSAKELKQKRADHIERIHRMLEKGMAHEDIFNLLADAWSDVDELSEANEKLCATLNNMQEVLRIHSETLKDVSGDVRLRILEMYAEMEDATALALLKGIELQKRTQASRSGKAGATKRHAPMAQLRVWAIDQFKKGKWSSANKAAHELERRVIDHGRSIGANLTEENAQRTIAEWFRKSKKSV